MNPNENVFVWFNLYTVKENWVFGEWFYVDGLLFMLMIRLLNY